MFCYKYVLYILCFFFFKQKTAYEMRISDWSSDVCSSDLVVAIDFHGSTGYGQAFTDSIRGNWGGWPLEDLQKGLAAATERYAWLDGDNACAHRQDRRLRRSEEHTSELQSLMRNSYAVFCLKKKKANKNSLYPNTNTTKD